MRRLDVRCWTQCQACLSIKLKQSVRSAICYTNHLSKPKNFKYLEGHRLREPRLGTCTYQQTKFIITRSLRSLEELINSQAPAANFEKTTLEKSSSKTCRKNRRPCSLRSILNLYWQEMIKENQMIMQNPHIYSLTTIKKTSRWRYMRTTLRRLQVSWGYRSSKIIHQSKTWFGSLAPQS